MIPVARGLSDGELAGELAARLGVAWHRAPELGAAAPRAQQAGAAAAINRRAQLVADLVRELAAVAAAHRGAAVEGPPAAGAEPAPEPAVVAPPVAAATAGAAAELEWLAIARAAGAAAARKVSGETTVEPSIVRPVRYPAKLFFVVARPAAAVADEAALTRRPSRGLVVGSFAESEGYVTVPGERGSLCPTAVFCGFHTVGEAEAYWSAIFPDAELLRLPRRRFR